MDSMVVYKQRGNLHVQQENQQDCSLFR